MDEAQVGAVQFVEAREDAAKLFELVDTTFDEMAFAVEPGIIGALERGRGMGRDDRFAAPRLDRGDEGRARIATIRDNLREREPLQERFGLGAVVALPSGQQRPQRIT